MYDTYSQEVEVKVEVPQGSVLDPILFKIYMNDSLQHIASKGNIYADDIEIWSVSDNHAGTKQLQRYLNTLSEWASQNGMTINTEKTKIL